MSRIFKASQRMALPQRHHYENSRISPSATALSKKESDEVIRPVVNVALSKSRICCKVARAAVFTPIKFQGLGLIHPYNTQGICNVDEMININHT
jgi:hypothetical protein